MKENYVSSTPKIFDRTTIERPCWGENYVYRDSDYHGLNTNSGVAKDDAIKKRKVKKDGK